MVIELSESEARSFDSLNKFVNDIPIRRELVMWTVVIVLLVLWALGFGFAGSTLGWLIHVLLVVAVVLAIVNLLRGRSAV
jgi:hypothetical protein